MASARGSAAFDSSVLMIGPVDPWSRLAAGRWDVSFQVPVWIDTSVFWTMTILSDPAHSAASWITVSVTEQNPFSGR